MPCHETIRKRSAEARIKARDPLAWKSFFRFLERERWILVSPMRDFKLRKPRFIPRALSAVKVEALIGVYESKTPTGARNRAVLEALYGTGLRLSECARLDLKDLDLKEGLLLVRNGKGKKDRYVPISGRARESVREYLDRAIRLRGTARQWCCVPGQGRHVSALSRSASSSGKRADASASG